MRALSAEMSSEATERKVGSRTISFRSGLTAPDEVALAGLWRDGELLWTTDFIWRAGSPQQTAPDGEMEAEAIRVIESLITEAAKQLASSRTLVVVSHTHWDREWYLPFEAFRARLVRMMDALLDLLDRDPEYKHFAVDGQTVPLDDYLEIRPDRRARHRAARARGAAARRAELHAAGRVPDRRRGAHPQPDDRHPLGARSTAG